MTEPCYDLTNEEMKEANRTSPIATTQAQFIDAVQKLGVRPGVRMVVHTRFSSLGNFEGGPEGLCKTLCDLVTPAGTLMLPGLVRYPKDGEPFVYDPLTTPAGFGLVPETFRHVKGVVRSLDPTHSFCVWGQDKEFFVKDHHKFPTMHTKSPLGLLEKAVGYALMIGCPKSVTFMHVVETSCGAHCLGSRNEEYDALLNGKKIRLRAWGWRDGNCRALRHNEIFDYMREHNALQETMLGRCHLLFFALKDYRTAYTRLLLAPENGCKGCPVAPRAVRQNVPSDWDTANDRLKETTCFTGDWDVAATFSGNAALS